MKYRLLCSLSLIGLLLCACNKNKATSIEVTGPSGEIDFHSEIQNRYINAENYLTTFGIASGSSSKEYPEPINISWTSDAKEADYVVNVYEKGTTSPYLSYQTKENQISIYNLKIKQQYQYEVVVKDNDKELAKSELADFSTSSKGPRNLYVNNVMNIRDLGGHGIKQGLIYRSGRFNETDGTTNIDEDTIKTMTQVLGVKTEIDLRRGNENGEITASPLGESVSYVHLPMYYGGENVLTHKGTHSGVEYDNPAQIKLFFETLADEKNYPIDFHCAIGKDRTGCMAYLIEALCGMEEEYLYRDYLFSNFAKISGMCEIVDIDEKYGGTLKAYEGDTLQEKTFNYLNNVIGVSEDNLEKIQNILTEK